MENKAGSDRELLIDNVDLDSILANGPSVPQSNVAGEIPPMPVAEVRPVQAEEKPLAEPPKEQEFVPIIPNEGPDKDMKNQMILPSDAEKAGLKARYGNLRVVPMPYTRGDNKIQTYVLRVLTRSQWRTMEDGARKIAENKPGVPAEEIFMEKIVSMACVWPALEEHMLATQPPGLVPTLFGIVQQMGLFFDPQVIMSATFAL